MFTNQQVAEILKKAQKAKGLKAPEVAAASGLSIDTYRGWLHAKYEKRPSLIPGIARMCQLLDVFQVVNKSGRQVDAMGDNFALDKMRDGVSLSGTRPESAADQSERITEKLRTDKRARRAARPDLQHDRHGGKHSL